MHGLSSIVGRPDPIQDINAEWFRLSRYRHLDWT